MKQQSSIGNHEITILKKGLAEYSRNFDYACILDSNRDIFGNQGSPSIEFDLIAGFGSKGNSKTINRFKELSLIQPNLNHWFLGYLTYDLKNYIENLESSNPDYLYWPEVFFFQPEILLLLKGEVLTIISDQSSASIRSTLLNFRSKGIEEYALKLKPRISKEEYLSHFSKIKEHIQLGDIYEINYCQEFYDIQKIDPYIFYCSLKDYSPSPFSAFYKYGSNYLMSASPERFLKKTGNRLLSQPIKGTASRDFNSIKDLQYKHELETSIKERAENIMIVDLVRNDLSRIARRNSVKVDELCGIHTFPQVFQMISTISAELEDCSFTDILRATFPMGSMTGAPKIAAMKIAEEHEYTKRGLYSGAVGYIAPGMDFDFNVVIRSLQYNAENSYLSYMTGSAITALSDAEKEYEECILKVYGLIKRNKIINYA